MTIPSKVLSAIQKVGQAVYDAQDDTVAFAAEQSRAVRKSLARSGVAATEVDAVYADWKLSVQLAQDLKEVNDRLTAVYASASGISLKRKGSSSTQANAVRATRRPRDPNKVVALRGNNAKLLAFLSGVLHRDTLTSVTQAQMAQGAAIPLGSVAYSVGRLISMGLIEEGAERGSLKLL